MKKLATLFALLFLPAMLFASNSSPEPETLIVAFLGVFIYLLIAWNIVNSATRADRILKAELAQLAYLKRLLESKGINADINPDEIRELNKKIKNIDLDKQSK